MPGGKLGRVDVGPRRVHGSWYRGEHCNVYPRCEDLFDQASAEEYILKGWLPEKCWITKRHRITAFGSCFADHITRHLTEAGYLTTQKEYDPDSHVIRCGDGIVNVHSLWAQFAWAWGDYRPKEQLWHGWEGNPVEVTEEARLETKTIFDSTDVFILTLGLSEVWFNKKTDDVFWRAIPKDMFDPEVHGFRVLTVEETEECLFDIYGLIRSNRPSSSIIFSLSPVPLAATFRPVGAVTANEVSKSVLRAALDQFLSGVLWPEVNDRLFYWPGYELVRYMEQVPFESDNRHLRRPVVDSIMDLFMKHYCVE